VTPSTLQIPHGEFILNFPATTLTNNTFLGWYTGVTPNDVLFTGTMPVVQDMTLFARWQQIVEIPVGEPGAVTWRVAFNATGGSTVDHVQVDDGRTMQLPVTTRAGYEFLGWFTGNLPGDVQFTSSTAVVRNMDLVARWERKSFMITFLSYGGSFVAPITAKAEAPITAPINPTRQNFSFGGWFTTVEYTTEFEFDEMPAANITLHALWTIGTYEGLRYTCSTTECIITGYEGIHSSIYIPAEIDELPVTMVADRAFEGNENLVSITFEDGEGSSSYLKTIGTSAFANMATLRDLTLPQTSLLTIKNDAFRNSSLLTAVDIPSGVTTLGTNVLTGTDSIERITVRPGNNSKSVATFNFKYLFGGTVFNSAVNVPLSLETVIVSEGATTIPNDFLRDLPMVREVVMPSSVTTMGTAVLFGANQLNSLTWTFTSSVDGSTNSFLSFAFSAAHGAITNVPPTLENVTINRTALTRIGSYAFYNIANLRNINLPNNITEIGGFSFAHAAVNTSRLEFISLPASVVTIRDSLFTNSTSLKDVDLPQNLVTIGNNAFQNTTSLVEIEIPNTVTTIGTGILTGANALTKLTYSNNYNSLLSGTRYLRYFFGGSSVTVGAVPATLKTVEITAGDALVASYFESIATIETIFLPSTITTINNRAFFGMTALRQVAVLGSIPTPDRVVLPSALTTLGTSVFQNAANIRHVTIPAAITTLPADTFNGATELTTVVTGTSMTVIGDRAFLNTKLSTFTFANNLTTIGANAFQGTLLTQVVVPNTVTSIGAEAFRNMSAITSITFPSTVPSVAPLFTLGANVLTGALVLTTINFHIDMLPTAGNRTVRYFFGGTTSGGGTIPTTLTTINLTGGTILGANFFIGVTTLVNVTLPNALIEIGAQAFDGATGITSLTIPQSVNNIGASAFRAMTGLVQLTFLRETLAATLGTTLFATSSASAVILLNLFIVVPTEAALTAYIVNAQFAAFNTVTPIRIVVATPAV
jgi:hypothetical protein